MQEISGLIGFLVLSLFTGFLASRATRSSVQSWYPRLEKPSWTPPNSVFMPAWTVLYIVMAVAVWLVWRAADAGDVLFALALFGVQLALNGAWSYLFFGLRRPGAALIDMGLLWIAILATLAVFAKFSGLAAWLLVPYLAWVSFAAALNFAIWRRNR